jgi:hypothetical protein
MKTKGPEKIDKENIVDLPYCRWCRRLWQQERRRDTFEAEELEVL